MYKVVISVCLFVCLIVCPIITHEPLDRFASNLIGKRGRTTGKFLARLNNSKLSGLTSNHNVFKYKI